MKHPVSQPPAETQPILLRGGKTHSPASPALPAPGNPRPISRTPAKKPRGGFTMLEMMMVVAIIALLVTVAVKNLSPNLGYAQDTRVQSDLQGISTSLKLYQAINGFLPTTEQGLKALVTKPESEPKPTQWRLLMEKVPQDPWHQDYHYVAPGKHNTTGFDLYSSGPDLKEGTADDIGNWDKSDS